MTANLDKLSATAPTSAAGITTYQVLSESLLSARVCTIAPFVGHHTFSGRSRKRFKGVVEGAAGAGLFSTITICGPGCVETFEVLIVGIVLLD